MYITVRSYCRSEPCCNLAASYEHASRSRWVRKSGPSVTFRVGQKVHGVNVSALTIDGASWAFQKKRQLLHRWSRYTPRVCILGSHWKNWNPTCLRGGKAVVAMTHCSARRILCTDVLPRCRSVLSIRFSSFVGHTSASKLVLLHESLHFA